MAGKTCEHWVHFVSAGNSELCGELATCTIDWFNGKLEWYCAKHYDEWVEFCKHSESMVDDIYAHELIERNGW